MTSLGWRSEAQCLLVCYDSDDKRPHLVPAFCCDPEVPGEGSSVQIPKPYADDGIATIAFFHPVAIPESLEVAFRVGMSHSNQPGMSLSHHPQALKLL